VTIPFSRLLIRYRIGWLRIGGLKPRQWRPLTKDEINDLKTGNSQKRESKCFDGNKKTNRRC